MLRSGPISDFKLGSKITGASRPPTIANFATNPNPGLNMLNHLQNMFRGTRQSTQPIRQSVKLQATNGGNSSSETTLPFDMKMYDIDNLSADEILKLHKRPEIDFKGVFDKV